MRENLRLRSNFRIFRQKKNRRFSSTEQTHFDLLDRLNDGGVDVTCAQVKMTREEAECPRSRHFFSSSKRIYYSIDVRKS